MALPMSITVKDEPRLLQIMSRLHAASLTSENKALAPAGTSNIHLRLLKEQLRLLTPITTQVDPLFRAAFCSVIPALICVQHERDHRPLTSRFDQWLCRCEEEEAERDPGCSPCTSCCSAWHGRTIS